jgi:hypothetical protein
MSYTTSGVDLFSSSRKANRNGDAFVIPPKKVSSFIYNLTFGLIFVLGAFSLIPPIWILVSNPVSFSNGLFLA